MPSGLKGTILTNPDQYPIFTNNEEVSILEITGVEPNLSPWGGPIDFTLFRAVASFFIDNLSYIY